MAAPFLTAPFTCSQNLTAEHQIVEMLGYFVFLSTTLLLLSVEVDLDDGELQVLTSSFSWSNT